MNIRSFAQAGSLTLILLIAGCSMYGDRAMHTHDAIADIAHSDKAIVFVDATSTRRSILLGERDLPLMVLYTTLHGRPAVNDCKPVVQDTFTAYALEPLLIEPGQYSFMGYGLLNGKSSENANIGGWTRTGRPLLAGFSVKAGDVVYLGHLDVITTIGAGETEGIVHLSVEDHSGQDGESMRRQLSKKFPGAAELLKTQLMQIYVPDVPVKKDTPNH